MKKLFNIVKIIHQLVYCLLLPIGIALYAASMVLYYFIMMFVPFIVYIFKGDFNTDYIDDIDDDDHIINRIFNNLFKFIYPNYD